LEECLSSLALSSQNNFELIIVDGLSKDRTVEIAGKYADKIITHPGNQAEARNVGFKVALGRYVLFIDADMVFRGDVVNDCVQVMDEAQAAAAWIPERSLSSAYWSQCLRFARSLSSESFRLPRVFRREAFERLYYNPGLGIFEDIDILTRARQLGLRICRANAMVEHYEPTNLGSIVIKYYARAARSALPTYVMGPAIAKFFSYYLQSISHPSIQVPSRYYPGIILIRILRTVAFLLGRMVRLLTLPTKKNKMTAEETSTLEDVN